MDLSQLLGLGHLLQEAVKNFISSRKAFYSLNGIGHRHDADAANYAVTGFAVGNDGTDVSFDADFLEGGIARKLRVLQDWKGFGKRSTVPASLSLDGAAQQNPAFVISHREGLEGMTLYERAVAQFEFDGADGQRQVFRFDIDLETVGA